MATLQRQHTEYLIRVRCKFPPGIVPRASVPGRVVQIVRQGHNAAMPLPRGWHPYLVIVPMTAAEIRDQSLPSGLALTINAPISRVELVWI